MAYQNHEKQEPRENRNTKETMRPEALIFNTKGLAPTEVSFQIDCATIQSFMSEQIQSHVSGLDSVAFQLDKRTNTVYWIGWFRNQDKNFYQDIDDSMLGTRLPGMSNDFKNFLKKFGYFPADDGTANVRKVSLNNIQLNNTNHGAGKVKGYRLALTPFLNIIFDINNEEFKKKFGMNASKPSCSYELIFNKDNTGAVVSLVGIKVTLKNASKFDKAKPYAAIPGRF